MRIEEQISAVKYAITDLTCQIVAKEKASDPSDFCQIGTLKARRDALAAARDSLEAFGALSKALAVCR